MRNLIRTALMAIGLTGSLCLPAQADRVMGASRGMSVELRESERPDASLQPSSRLYSHSYALVIGIDNYTNGWPRLSNAIRDARAVANEMAKRGFEVQLTLNPDAGRLKQTLEDFFIDKGSEPDARLFVWFAGHGHTERGNGYLIPADGALPRQNSRDFRRRAINMRAIGGWVRDALSKHVMVVFDSCFGGTVFSSARSAPPPAITRLTGQTVRQFLTSGDDGQTVSDDGTFRRQFLAALRGERAADHNRDGYLTASELGLFLTDRISSYTNNKQTPRYGKLSDQNYDKGDFVFKLAALTPEPSRPNRVSDQTTLDLLDLNFWQAIKDSRDLADFQEYLRQFPKGRFAYLAKRALARLQQKPDLPQAVTTNLRDTANSPAKPIADRTIPPPIPPITPMNKTMRVATAGSINIRRAPTTRAAKIAVLKGGASIRVTGKTKGTNWRRVEMANGGTGYVYGPLLQEKPPSFAEALKQGCDDGRAESCFQLGKLHYNGRDYAFALSYFSKACNGGEMQGCGQLGYMYQRGQGVKRNFATARHFFEQSCVGRDMRACNDLGRLHHDGLGGAKNILHAQQLYEKACNGGNAAGCNNLGHMYRQAGTGVQKDWQVPVLFERACRGGIADGCNQLGHMYQFARGVKRDYTRARKFYRQACDGGIMPACSSLALVYFQALDVQQDYGIARELYKKACNGGVMAGCFSLGLMYQYGQGVDKDLRRAQTFFKRSCDGGDQDGCAKILNLVSGRT